MNVREEILREKIDPFLTPERLAVIAQLACAEMGDEAGAEAQAGSAAGGELPRIGEVKVLSGGCWNRVIEVSFSSGESRIVCKISPEERDEKIIREYRVLGFFASRTAMPVPRPLLIDTTGRLLPGTLLVMSRVPGIVLHRVFGLLTREMIDGLTDQIAAQLIELHKERSSGFGGVEMDEEIRQQSWADFWLPRFDGVFTEVISSGLVDSELLRQIERARSHFPVALDIGRRSTLTHYDIWSGNVMVDFEGSGYPGQPFVSSYIDIPGYWADYARELSFMEMFGLASDRFYDRYWSAFPKDEGFQLRKNIYNLKMHLKHITMYPDEAYYRQGAEAALRFIQRIL
ncbi:MAG: fructosamine kinase family protein [Spirochaetaceae bacterium]|nr:MAG: fructosamine kinase family protein [Spirochaetaceae bacterium]